MGYKLLDLSNKKEWSKYISKLHELQQDIYFTPEYYSLYEKNGDGKAQCFVFEDNGEIALYPFLINSVNKLGYKLDKQYFDIQGAYGYNGPAVSSKNENFILSFSKEFKNFCTSQNVIAEFIRFNPVLQNQRFINYIDPILINYNIILDLNMQDIWMNAYEHSTRKNVKKALRNNLIVKYYTDSNISDSELMSFIKIYYKTMDRNSAAYGYYLSEEFFREIVYNLSGKALFFFTYKDNKIISCELVLISKKIGYSFLGGTLSEFYEFRPNDLLKHEIINLLKLKKYDYFCFGGGTKPNDGIFNYKKKFARNGVYDFYIGKKIHNKEIYNEVIRQWEYKYPVFYDKNKKMLLGYREITKNEK